MDKLRLAAIKDVCKANKTSGVSTQTVLDLVAEVELLQAQLEFFKQKEDRQKISEPLKRLSFLDKAIICTGDPYDHD